MRGGRCSSGVSTSGWRSPAACRKRISRGLAAGNDGFDGDDLLVLEATDELLVAGRAAPETWQRLVDELGTHQAMELIFVVGTYAMLAMACDTWALVPPPGSAQLPEPRTDR